jgi:formate dehydrogenase accessory protein FdhE
MPELTKTQRQFLMSYLSFHEDLLKVQVKNMQHLIAVFSFDKLNAIDLGSRLANGDYLIHPEDILVEEKDLEIIFDNIFAVMKEHRAEHEDLILIEDLNDKRKIVLGDIINIVLSRDEERCKSFAQKYGLGRNFLRRFGEYLASPYLELCSEYFTKKLQNVQIQSSRCPVCGNYPSMAMVNEQEDSRILWCHLCNTEWNYSHPGCPFCLNTDLKQLEHIFLPEKSPMRIDACNKCNHYIKIIDDQLITKKPKFIVDYLASYELDIFALQNGYKKFKSC